jgi:hypothetical protein
MSWLERTDDVPIPDEQRLRRIDWVVPVSAANAKAQVEAAASAVGFVARLDPDTHIAGWTVRLGMRSSWALFLAASTRRLSARIFHSPSLHTL